MPTTTTEEEGSMSDRSTQDQTQARSGTQLTVSTPGTRVQRQSDGGTRQVTTAAASMTITFIVERISPGVPGKA